MILTNDDGIDAPGLGALERACRGLGELFVVAPATARSGVGHSLTTGDPIPFVRVAADRWSVDAMPADCARLGLCELATGADWLLSGINRGGNLGVDIFTSGTVAAAREATILGCSALSISQYVGPGREVDWDATAQRAAAILSGLLARPPEPGGFWNVNLPHPEDSGAACEAVFCSPDVQAHAVRYECADGCFRYRGDYHGRPREPGRDVDVCFSGRVAVSRIPLDPAR